MIFGGAHAGISVGPDGATHQALEDLALARVLPRMTVVAPCDSEETRKAVLAAADHPGPVYLRFGREAVPVITDRTTPFAIGKARPVREGQDCAVFACGALVYEALAGRGAGRPGHLPPSHRPAHHQAPRRRGGYRSRPPVRRSGHRRGASGGRRPLRCGVGAAGPHLPGAHGGRVRPGHLWGERPPGGPHGPVWPGCCRHRPGGAGLFGPGLGRGPCDVPFPCF